jgi:transposase
MKKRRKHHSPEEKVGILRRHLLEKEPISTLCDELGLQPGVFYHWQKEFFASGAAAFEQKARPNHSAEQERIAELEKKIQTEDEDLAELMAEHVAQKKTWGTLTGVWVPHDPRDQTVDFVRRWSEKTEIGAGRFIEWLDITASKFYDWRERYGKVNEHNGWAPAISGWRSGRSRPSSGFT